MKGARRLYYYSSHTSGRAHATAHSCLGGCSRARSSQCSLLQDRPPLASSLAPTQTRHGPSLRPQLRPHPTRPARPRSSLPAERCGPKHLHGWSVTRRPSPRVSSTGVRFLQVPIAYGSRVSQRLALPHTALGMHKTYFYVRGHASAFASRASTKSQGPSVASTYWAEGGAPAGDASRRHTSPILRRSSIPSDAAAEHCLRHARTRRQLSRFREASAPPANGPSFFRPLREPIRLEHCEDVAAPRGGTPVAGRPMQRPRVHVAEHSFARELRTGRVLS